MILIQKDELKDFFSQVFNQYYYDFRDYNQNTMKRRIQIHSLFIGIVSFSAYSKLIISNKKYFNEMFSYLCIHVTEFFREAIYLKLLKEKIFPYLKSYPHLKIWYPACSSGENAYSLAIMLDEFGLLKKSQIYASDFNSEILKEAQKGEYSLNKLEMAKINYSLYEGNKSFENYIIKNNESFRLKDYLCEKVLFFNHNLECDNVMNEFHLIICQNVFIYFNNVLKNKVTHLFENSLCINGFLIIGQKEYIKNEALINFREYENDKRIYQKCK